MLSEDQLEGLEGITRKIGRRVSGIYRSNKLFVKGEVFEIKHNARRSTERANYREGLSEYGAIPYGSQRTKGRKCSELIVKW